MSETQHSTTQAHEQGQDLGPKPDEHPQDLRSRPNDAHNDHKSADSGLNDVEYPPQLHAGKVGLGPHYAEQNQATFGDQIAGLKEQLKGKMAHDPHLVEEGHDRMTGELKRKQREKENEFKPGGPGGSEEAPGAEKQEGAEKKPEQKGTGSSGEQAPAAETKKPETGGEQAAPAEMKK